MVKGFPELQGTLSGFGGFVLQETMPQRGTD